MARAMARRDLRASHPARQQPHQVRFTLLGRRRRVKEQHRSAVRPFCPPQVSRCRACVLHEVYLMAGSFLAALMFGAVIALAGTSATTTLQGQRESAVLSPPEREAFSRLAKLTSGRFIWSSNRSGNHELYAVDLADLRVDRLTNHPHVDYFARVSPDGRRSRSLEAGVRKHRFAKGRTPLTSM